MESTSSQTEAEPKGSRFAARPGYLPLDEFSQDAESTHGPTRAISGTKWSEGSASDGKHYWLTPPDLMEELQAEFDFDFDPCPYPVPANFDGLTCEWGKSNYVNAPYGSIIHDGKKKGPTAWVRKAIEEHAKGKRVVFVYPIDKWVLMLLAAGAQVRNLGDVRWCAIEDGSQGAGTGRHIAAFILEPSQHDEKADNGGDMPQISAR